MYTRIERIIKEDRFPVTAAEIRALTSEVDILTEQAFRAGDANALLLTQRLLYRLNMAHLAKPWEFKSYAFASAEAHTIKRRLEAAIESSEQELHNALVSDLPKVADFTGWIQNKINNYESNELHPLFFFLKDAATFEQLREFFFQETPLEMLFADILAFMLPGVYGSIKIEYLKNYWDEMGHANDEKIHRNLRAKLMDYLQIPADCYVANLSDFVVEELILINMYLSMATDRSKHLQLIGAMLATELMIPGRFDYQISGWRRFGVPDDTLEYLIEHTGIDEVHAEDWLFHVVMPIVENYEGTMKEIVLGVSRRLYAANAVCDRLLAHLKDTETACIGSYSEFATKGSINPPLAVIPEVP